MINRRANLVEGNPSPSKFDVGNVALLGDAGDGHQFSACGRNAKGLLLGIAGRDETLKRVHA